VRLPPVLNSGLCPGFGGSGVRNHQQDILVQFGELGGVIASHIDEEQSARILARRFLRQRDIESVDLLDLAPAIQMQAFRIAPPLPTQILMAILRLLSDRKPHVVQFDVRAAAIAADIKHE